MRSDKISEEWMESIRHYFTENGDPFDWFVFKEYTDDGGETWGIGNSEIDGGETMFTCDSFEEARVIMACFLFTYEIVSGKALIIEKPQGDYFVGQAGNA